MENTETLELADSIKKLNSKLKVLDNHYDQINHNNIEQFQRDNARKKLIYIKAFLYQITNTDINEKFKLNLSYEINNNDINNKYKFNIRIIFKNREILSTYFYSKIIYIGFDVFEYLISFFVKNNWDKVHCMNYDSQKDISIIKSDKINITSQIPNRYLVKTNEIYKYKQEKERLYKTRR